MTTQQIKTAAVLRISAKRQMPVDVIAALLAARAGHTNRYAAFLARQWVKTKAYRTAA